MARNHTTVRKVEQLIEMFIDATAGEVYEHGRLATVETDDSVQLVAYGNEVLAEVSKDGKDMTIYVGHHGTVSKTVTGYIKTLGSVLNRFEGRSVDARYKESPTLGIGARASESAQYIDHYVGNLLKESFSPVEQDARADVERALDHRMAEIFGE